jgi:hypothetical protein
MNMGAYGGRLQRIGLANMQAMADIENKRIWDDIEQKNLESEAKNEAIGSLGGNVAGLGMAGYSEYQRGQKNRPMESPPGGAMATEAAAKESVSPNKVLGANSVIAEKAPSLSQVADTKAQDQVGLYRPAILDAPDPAYVNPGSLPDRPVVPMKSPTRRVLSDTYISTSDQFQSAMNNVISAWRPFIGSGQ